MFCQALFNSRYESGHEAICIVVKSKKRSDPLNILSSVFCHVTENVFKAYVKVTCTMQKKGDARRNLTRIFLCKSHLPLQTKSYENK